ncbi:MAG: CHAT domain-containing protein, partial [Microcoleus sp.]
ADNIERAIAAFNVALNIYTCEAFPVDWAGTQNNLGLAYGDRILGEKADNIERAIAAYHAALTVTTCEAFPFEWATTQNNLGNAYRDRILGEKADNIENAIAAYHAALTVTTRDAFPVYWAMTQNNLGNAYRDRILGEKADNIERAIAAYNQALTVTTREAFPVYWAGTQNNLGNAYNDRIFGEEADNIENAIAAYNQALTVTTRDAFPVNWATTQNNLGTAYRGRILGEKADNIEKGIEAFNAALNIYARSAFPQENAKTLENLGLLYYNEKHFSSAYNTFLQAIETVESLREEIVSGEESKRKQAEKWNNLYRCMVETCLELGFNEQAIEYSDRSKTRNLVELMATRHIYPKGKIPKNQRQELQQIRKEIKTEKRRLATDSQPDYTHINQLRQWYKELYPFEPIRFHQIQELLDNNTAIIQWYVFDDCFRAFIITQNNSIVWKSSSLDLNNLVNWVKEYLQTYIAPRQAETESAEQQLQQEWQDSLDSRLQNLAEFLQINDILSQLPGTINQLIFIPHLYLHILPLHSLPVNQEIWQHFNPNSSSPPNHPLLDCFNNGVRYAPSCQLLRQVQQQQRPQFERLFAIQTPTEDLYKEYEQDLGAVAAIKKQFPDSPCILKKDQAKKSAILQIDETTNTVTPHEQLLESHSIFFFCHGYFNFNSPLDSGLQLADADLSLAEIIEHFDLTNTRLVTLSACETGLIDLKNMSDEYIGLPNGFLLAGSTNVVSSLWTVSAAATALLMIKFYQELQQKTNIALALNTAQIWLRDTTIQGFQTWLGNSPLDRTWQRELRKDFDRIQAEKGASTKPFKQPYYWAAFCTIGKGV